MPFATNLDFPVFVTRGSEIHLNYPLIIGAVAEYLTIACGFICAQRLYRCAGKVTQPLPVASILIIAVTAVTTGLQFFVPGTVPAMERNLPALRAGEWWRTVTPLLIQPCGWGQCCWNGMTALLLLPLAEKCYGHRLGALYVTCGLMGQVAHYAFDPIPSSGGSSTAIYGVMGALFAFACRHGRGISRSTAVLAILGLCGAIVQSVLHDFHGVGMLTGAVLAAGMRGRLATGAQGCVVT